MSDAAQTPNPTPAKDSQGDALPASAEPGVADGADAGDLSQDDLDLLTRAATEADSATASTVVQRPRPGVVSSTPAPLSPGQDLDLPEFAAVATPLVSDERISMLSDVNLNVKIELGRTRMLIEDVLKLDAGSVVELDKLAGDPVDVFANDRLIARGEVLVLNESFCVRISEVFAGDPHRVV